MAAASAFLRQGHKELHKAPQIQVETLTGLDVAGRTSSLKGSIEIRMISSLILFPAKPQGDESTD